MCRELVGLPCCTEAEYVVPLFRERFKEKNMREKSDFENWTFSAFKNETSASLEKIKTDFESDA
jgi:hypothetical protein